MHICEYGCGQEAKYQFKNSKWCCSRHSSQCPGMKKRFISVHNKEKICDRCKKSISKSGWRQHRNACKVNICLNCGKAINKGKKFCNQSCAAIYNNARRKKLQNTKQIQIYITTRRCPVCNKPLEPQQRFHCSPTCRDKAAELRVLNGDNHTSPRTIKRYLIKTRGHRCEICGNTKWMNNPIPLVLDHIDGNSYNNDLENMRLVCGNCDMQLPTYKGRNIGRGRYKRRQRYKEGKSY